MKRRRRRRSYRIWSRHDSLVAPQANATLGCAENIALIGVGHNALVSDRQVMELVVKLVEKVGET